MNVNLSINYLGNHYTAISFALYLILSFTHSPFFPLNHTLFSLFIIPFLTPCAIHYLDIYSNKIVPPPLACKVVNVSKRDTQKRVKYGAAIDLRKHGGKIYFDNQRFEIRRQALIFIIPSNFVRDLDTMKIIY